MKSLQELYSPQGICFGCGVANPKGLQLKSFPQESTEQLVATWRAQEHHQAFPGMLNGGIIGALLDCHCNWTAAYSLMRAQGKSAPDCTVTAEYSIKLHQPTPVQAEIHLRAWPTRIGSRSASIEGELWAEGQLCASCTGVFVSVKEGHPAYHQW